MKISGNENWWLCIRIIGEESFILQSCCNHTTSAAAAGEAVRNYSLMSSWNNH